MVPLASPNNRTFLDRTNPLVRGRVTWFPLQGHGRNMGDTGGGIALPSGLTYDTSGNVTNFQPGNVGVNVAATCTAQSMGIAGSAPRTIIMRATWADNSYRTCWFGLGNGANGQDCSVVNPDQYYWTLQFNGWAADFRGSVAPGYGNHDVVAVITYDGANIVTITSRWRGLTGQYAGQTGTIQNSGSIGPLQTPASAVLNYACWPANGANNSDSANAKLYWFGILGGTCWSNAEALRFVNSPSSLWQPAPPVVALKRSVAATVTATAAGTLGRPSGTVTTKRGERATVAATLAKPTGAITARRGERGTIASSLARPAGVVSTKRGEKASVAGSMARPTGSIAAKEGSSATAASTFARPSGSVVTVQGTSTAVNGSFPRPTGAAQAKEGSAATVAGTLARPSGQVAARYAPNSVSMVATGLLARPAGSGNARRGETTGVSGTMPRPAGTVSAQYTPSTVTATVSGSLVRPSGVVAAKRGENASATGSLARPAGSVQVKEGAISSVAGTLPRPNGAATVKMGARSTVSGSLAQPVGRVSAAYSASTRNGTVSGSFPRPVGAATARSGVAVQIAGSLARPTGSALASQSVGATISGTLPKLIGLVMIHGDKPDVVTVAGMLARPTGYALALTNGGDLNGERTVMIKADYRTFEVPNDPRTVMIEADPRTFVVPSDPRTVEIIHDPRFLTVSK